MPNYKFIRRCKFVLIVIILLSILNEISAQYSKREAKELNSVLKYLIQQGGVTSTKVFADTVFMSSHFEKYKHYYETVLSQDKATNDLDTYLGKKHKPYLLSEVEKKHIINILQNDTSQSEITKDLIANTKIKIVSDTSINLTNFPSITEIAKPIFFRNYTLCLIIKYGRLYLDSYFLRKLGYKWVYYKQYYSYIV